MLNSFRSCRQTSRSPDKSIWKDAKNRDLAVKIGDFTISNRNLLQSMNSGFGSVWRSEFKHQTLPTLGWFNSVKIWIWYWWKFGIPSGNHGYSHGKTHITYLFPWWIVQDFHGWLPEGKSSCLCTRIIVVYCISSIYIYLTMLMALICWLNP